MRIQVVRGEDGPATRRLSNTLSTRHPIVTIGKFDGMHLGHAALFKASADAAAAQVGSARVLMSFAPHPEDYFALRTGSYAPRRHEGVLMPIREKIRRADENGFEYFFIAKFDERFASLSCREFVERFLVEALHARHVIVGYDWAFGKDRSGDVSTLRELGAEFGIDISEVPPIELDGQRVSSKRIRQLISEGDVRRASRLLGRSYMLLGFVKPGVQRGRSLGFPTANLSDLRQLIPRHGVYACKLESDGEWAGAVVNVGTRPTFDHSEVTVEAHILDRTDLELYGKRIRVAFIERLRDEIRFESARALSEAIAQDVSAARAVLAAEDNED